MLVGMAMGPNSMCFSFALPAASPREVRVGFRADVKHYDAIDEFGQPFFPGSTLLYGGHILYIHVQGSWSTVPMLERPKAEGGSDAIRHSFASVLSRSTDGCERAPLLGPRRLSRPSFRAG